MQLEINPLWKPYQSSAKTVISVLCGIRNHHQYDKRVFCYHFCLTSFTDYRQLVGINEEHTKA